MKRKSYLSDQSTAVPVPPVIFTAQRRPPCLETRLSLPPVSVPRRQPRRSSQRSYKHPRSPCRPLPALRRQADVTRRHRVLSDVKRRCPRCHPNRQCAVDHRALAGHRGNHDHPHGKHQHLLDTTKMPHCWPQFTHTIRSVTVLLYYYLEIP